MRSGVVELETGVGTLPRIRLEDSSGARDSVWHIVRHESSAATGVLRSSKVISEVFLTRLLATKVTHHLSHYSDLHELVFPLFII